jgi:hypothetical protein
MRRSVSLLALIGLTLGAVGCDGGDGKDSGASPAGSGADGDEGMGDGSDDGSEDGSDDPLAATVVVESVRSLSPATLPEEVGGSVRLAVRATAADADGETVPVETVLGEASFAVLLPDGTELPCSSEDGGDGYVYLEFAVPPGLAPGVGGRVEGTLLVDGVAGPVVPVRLHVDESGLLEGFVGDPAGQVAVEDGSEKQGAVCDTIVVDADGDGRVEVITVGVDDSGFRATICAATADGDGVSWECEDDAVEVEGSGGGLFCGETDHFLVDGGVGVVGSAVDAEGRLAVLGPFVVDGKGFGGPLTPPDVSASSFAVVLGLNNTKKEPETPNIATLGVQGGSGSWTGVFEGPEGPWEWRTLAGFEAAAFATGKAFGGLTSELSLWGLSGGPSLVWALDPTQAGRGGKLVVEVAVPDGETKSFTRIRQVSLDDPGFAVEAAAAVFGDVDGDDHPEMVLEVWGEGRWAAWLVPAATDKTDSRPATVLESGLEEHVGWVQSHPGATGAVRSSFTVTGAAGDTLSAVVPVFSGVGATPETLSETVNLKELSWDLGWVSGGSSGKERVDDVYDHGQAHRGEPDEKRLGICCHGRCFSPPGYGGSSRLSTGGGDGLSAATLAPGARAFVSIDPEGGGTVLASTSKRPGAPKGQIRSPRVRVLVEAFADDALGLSDGETVLAELGPSAQVATTEEAADGTVAVVVFEPRSVAPASDDSRSPVVVQVDLRVRYGDGASGQLVLPPATTTGGTSVPVLLSREVSGEGGVVLGWRDGTGQAWLGVVDLGAAVAAADREAVPFLQGPVAVGAPLVDADEALGLSTGRPGMVRLEQGIIADTPFLSMEDLETRFSDWEEPLEGAFAGGAGAYGAVAVLVGTERGGVETVYVLPTDSLDAAETVVLVEEQSPALSTPVPQLSGHLVADAPPVLVMLAADGTADLLLVDGTGPRAGQSAAVAFDGSPERLAGADLNGDGITDLVLPAGTGTQLALSDGTGGWLETTVDPSTLLGFDRVLTGGGTGQEAPLDPDGGRGLAVGGPAVGDWVVVVE